MIKRVIINILLLVLTILEFSKAYLTPELHEIIGILLILLLIIHLLQNRKYIKSISGKNRKILYFTNILLLITFSATMILGLLSSQLIPILNIHLIITNYLHKILAYITLIFVSIHLGQNLNKMLYNITIRVKQVITVIISIFGIISFMDVDYINHITGNIGFATNNTNIFINSLEYLSIILTIALITHLITCRVQN